mmetsp:Transcript_46293/g.91286  ORF Transcript_46293/g.91286 Transcript_46293/m.91286 type:complete len:94 (+) Transcript_46293:114-395(+)
MIHVPTERADTDCQCRKSASKADRQEGGTVNSIALHLHAYERASERTSHLVHNCPFQTRADDGAINDRRMVSSSEPSFFHTTTHTHARKQKRS